MHTELYDILELQPNATQEDIKKNYRKLAIKYHPDRNIDKKEECTRKTQEINFAYEILSNPEKRENYDKNGLEEQPQHNHFNPFEHLMRQQRQQRQEPKEELTLKINLKKIFNGKEKLIQITQKCKCPKCDTTVKKCVQCDGNGFNIRVIQMGPMISQQQLPCPVCHQTGKILKSQNCNECVNGLITKKIDYQLVIQKNQDYKNIIKLEGYGNYNFDKNKHNDLFVKFEIKDEIYEVENYDILHTFKIHASQAMTGNDIFVHHPNGKIYKLTTNDVIHDNDVKMIKNLGLPSSYGYGNFIIKFTYIYPEKLLTVEDYALFIATHENEKYEDYVNEYLLNIEQNENEEEQQQPHELQPPQCTPS